MPIEKMCNVLDVSTSGYYNWNNRKVSRRKLENEKIKEIIINSYKEAQGMIGLDKLWADVKETYPKCSRKRVYSIQKKNKLYSVRKKPFRVGITDSNHELTKAPNLLDQKFDVAAPFAVWVTDITQFETQKGKAYLATVKDIFHKEIVGWAVATHMRTELCLEALRIAVRKHRPPKGLIHHSDQGVQYCSNVYIKELESFGMIRSMSRKGNCWDNACAETFFSTIKSERIHHKTYENIEKAKQDIFWYIECFYNRQRRHSAIEYMTPETYLNQYYRKQKAA